MIKLKTNKEQLKSLMRVISSGINDVQTYRELTPSTPQYSWDRMQSAAEIFILEALHNRVIAKYYSMGSKINTHPCTFSWNEMEAYLFVKRVGAVNGFSPFERLIIEQVKAPVCKKLLA